MSTPLFAPIACKNALFDLASLLPAALTSSEVSLPTYARICALYRRLGVGSLLISGDPRDFFGYLFRSGRAFLHYAEGAPAPERLASKASPFLDAIACRDDEGARRIAVAMPRMPVLAREYEEDFYYLRLLMDLSLDGSPPSQPTDNRALLQMLVAWQALDVEGSDFRRDVCAALVERDQGLFDRATDVAIAELRRSNEKKQRADELPPAEAATTAQVSIDVLAWLELARRRGLDSSRDLPLAPSLARAFHRLRPQQPDSWRQLV